MIEEQTKKLLKRIKANYPSFRNDNEDVIKEWHTRLKNYLYEDIDYSLDRYLEADNQEAPRVNSITYGIKTIKEQNQEIVGIFYCSSCHKGFQSLIEANECYERDRTIAYITKMCKLFGINADDYFKPQLKTCSTNEIDKHYNEFIIRIIEEQKKNPKLKNIELMGLREYYKHVIQNN
jgi:hypothetical protein